MPAVKYSLLADTGTLSVSSDSDNEQTTMLGKSKPDPKQLLHDYKVSQRKSSLGCCGKLSVALSVLAVIVMLTVFGLAYTGNIQPLLHKIFNLTYTPNTNITSTQNGNKSKSTIVLPPIALSPLPNESQSYHKSSDPAPFSDWETELLWTGSESPLRVYDVNEDGVLDVMVGLTYDKPSRTIEPEHCKQYRTNDGCAGGITCFDGRNGNVIWTIYTKDEVYELTCLNEDFDSDGTLDCIASGRYGTLLAFNPKSADIIWSMPDGVNEKWNAFAPAFIQDISGDGIRDIVLVNGGDTQYTPEQRNRDGSHMLAMNSATGEVIGKPFLIPDFKESYTLPVVYTFPDGSQYIIFGSGGETVSGGGYIVSLKDMLNVTNPGQNINLKGSYRQWADIPRDYNGVITLYQSEKRGVMVPASLVDLNNDDVDDIVMMSFDGMLLAFNGEDLSHLWPPVNFTVDSPTESYTFPVFGYFNDDDKLDIMVSWQTGSWPAYDSLMIFIMDGKNGTILWYKDTPIAHDYTVAPPVLLNTEQLHRDAFIFRMSSTNMPFEKGQNTADIGDIKRSVGDLSYLTRSDDGTVTRQINYRRIQSNRVKRHIGMHSTNEPSCNETDKAFVDIFIMDRDNMHSPLQLYRQHSEAYHYNVTKEMVRHYKFMEIMSEDDGGKHMTGRKRRHGDHHDEDGDDDDDDQHTAFDPDAMIGTQRCARFNDRDSSSGILTDLEGDGKLDYISADVAFVHLRIHDEDEHPSLILKVIIRKFRLEDIYPSLPSVKLEEVSTGFTSSESKNLTQLKLAKLPYQKWPQHLGRGQDGKY